MTAPLRIIDANLNRATEGLRVVEEYARMVLEDAQLSQIAKELRHELAALTQSFGPEQLAASRDTPGDVGTGISTASEAVRLRPWDVALASCKRAQQALRSIEEYGKLVDAMASSRAEQLRYRLYTLEKSLLNLALSRERLEGAKLYVLVDGQSTAEQFTERVAQLANGGVDVIQLRDKRLDDRTLLQRARLLAKLCREYGVVSIVNDRPDLAMLAAADGVHLGQDDLSVAEARRILGTDALVGVSTHAIEQARQAVLEGANYIGAGPTFPSGTKSFDEFPGLDYLRQLADEVSLPAFAIGGIDAPLVAHILETGVTRVAVAGAVTNSKDPEAAARALKSKLVQADTNPTSP